MVSLLCRQWRVLPMQWESGSARGVPVPGGRHPSLLCVLCCAGNGDCPCSGRMGEQKCPEVCLCLEVVICFTQSVASTRWMLQDEMHVSGTPRSPQSNYVLSVLLHSYVMT